MPGAPPAILPKIPSGSRALQKTAARPSWLQRRLLLLSNSTIFPSSWLWQENDIYGYFKIREAHPGKGMRSCVQSQPDMSAPRPPLR